MTTSQDRMGGELPSLSSSLLDRVQKMQPEAWSRLTSVFSPIVYRWSREAGLDAADSADVVQEVFIAVARNVSKFERKKEKASFRSWLATITRNKVRDRFRRIQRGFNARGGTQALEHLNNLAVSEPSFDDTAIIAGSVSDEVLSQVIDHQQLETRIPAQVLQLVKANCDQNTWNAFWLTTAKEMPAADVARELGISIASVYQAKSRILRRIRTRMEELP